MGPWTLLIRAALCTENIGASRFATYDSAVEILWSFVRHWSDRILDFVGLNKILSDQTFLYSLLLNYVELFGVIFINLKDKSTPSKV